MLIREVALSPIDVPQRSTRVQVLWLTGAVSDFTTARPSKLTARATPPEAIELIRQFTSAQRTDAAIAAELNRRGVRSGRNHLWTAHGVRWVRWRYQIERPNASPPPSVRRPDQRPDGLYSVHGVAARFQVTDHIVHYWIQRGWLKGSEGGGPGTAWWFKLDRATVRRLQAAKVRGYGPKRTTHSETRAQEEPRYE
jgi:hypothetical protein